MTWPRSRADHALESLPTSSATNGERSSRPDEWAGSPESMPISRAESIMPADLTPRSLAFLSLISTVLPAPVRAVTASGPGEAGDE